MNTEGGRIANLLTVTRQCMAAESLAKARALGSGKSCGALCGAPQGIIGPHTPLPSMLLEATVKNCYYKFQSLEGCVPESIRIARVQQDIIDKSTDSTNPNTRFAMYDRIFPAACPPPPVWYANAGQPILQGKNCALPNKPDNPVLPG